jgi:hypothetical protein
MDETAWFEAFFLSSYLKEKKIYLAYSRLREVEEFHSLRS